MGQEYKPTKASFAKWCKDHPWNSAYQDEKEYHKIGKLFVELSLSENMDRSLSSFCAIREFVVDTFKTVYMDSITPELQAEIKKKQEAFSKRHKVKIVCEAL